MGVSINGHTPNGWFISWNITSMDDFTGYPHPWLIHGTPQSIHILIGSSIYNPSMLWYPHDYGPPPISRKHQRIAMQTSMAHGARGESHGRQLRFVVQAWRLLTSGENHGKSAKNTWMIRAVTHFFRKLLLTCFSQYRCSYEFSILKCLDHGHFIVDIIVTYCYHWILLSLTIIMFRTLSVNVRIQVWMRVWEYLGHLSTHWRLTVGKL